MVEALLIIAFILLVIYGNNWLMGYRNGNITLNLEDRYTNLNEYVRAIQGELEKQGKDVEYIGYREFIVNEKRYFLEETNVPMGGVPLQRTILKRVKKK